MPLSHRVRFGYIENVYIILLFAKEGRLHEATCLSNFATPDNSCVILSGILAMLIPFTDNMMTV